MRDDFSFSLLAALELAAPGAVSANADLAAISRWKIGGRAAALVEPVSVDQVRAVMRVMQSRPEPLFVMGDASNILFDSKGFNGVVMRIGRRLSRMQIDGNKASAEAGMWVPLFARRVGCAGLSGIEHTVGIPGTLGGLVMMNGGSQRKGIGLNVTRVRCVDANGDLLEFGQDDCGFAYRTSFFQSEKYVIVSADFSFSSADAGVVRREMLDILASRKKKFPKNLPNCGSTFLSDPAMYETVGPPGLAIERAGLKGVAIGGAQISPLHANFIVNTGGATSDDVLGLIGVIRKTVHAKTGYFMDCEVRYISPDGLIFPAHEAVGEG